MTETKALSEAILLAAASGLSYAMAYAYRSGHASYFDLPPLLLTPTLGGILQAAAALGAILFTVWNVLSGIWVFLPRQDSAVGRSARRLLLMLVVAVLMSYSLFTYRWGWIFLVIVMCFFGFFEFVFPMMTQRKVTGYESKLLAQEGVERNTRITLYDEAVNRIGGKGLLLILAGFVLLSFARAVGYATAKTQTDYFVLTDTPNYVVAEMDDNIVILAAYDWLGWPISREPGRYRAVLYYINDPKKGIAGSLLSENQPGVDSLISTSTPCKLMSNEVTVEITQ